MIHYTNINKSFYVPDTLEDGVITEESGKVKRNSKVFFIKDDETCKEIFNLMLIPKSLLQQSSENILATLTELTATTIAQAIKHKQQSINEIIIFGGGIKNLFLVERIGHYVSLPIVSSELMGYGPQSIEAMAFGWLASQRITSNPLRVGKHKGLLGKITKFKS